jgi:hypothetical protein
MMLIQPAQMILFVQVPNLFMDVNLFSGINER